MRNEREDEARQEQVEPDELTTQQQLQQLYEEQMRRLACPGCGEEAFRG